MFPYPDDVRMDMQEDCDHKYKSSADWYVPVKIQAHAYKNSVRDDSLLGNVNCVYRIYEIQSDGSENMVASYDLCTATYSFKAFSNYRVEYEYTHSPCSDIHFAGSVGYSSQCSFGMCPDVKFDDSSLRLLTGKLSATFPFSLFSWLDSFFSSSIQSEMFSMELPYIGLVEVRYIDLAWFRVFLSVMIVSMIVRHIFRKIA